MKKVFPFFMALGLAVPVMGQTSLQSEIEEGIYATSISDNGEWLMGQADGEGFLVFKNLVTGKTYQGAPPTTADGTGCTSGVGKCIANNGTAVALINGIPYYWQPVGTNGKWTKLPGRAADGSAMMGSITPDARIIVGGTGDTGLSTGDLQNTKACYWFLQDDGTYSNPVLLPAIGKDPFGAPPQLVNAVAVSSDGKVVSVTVTTNNGFYEVPYVYVQDEDGNWSAKDLGSQLFNPLNREVPKDPGGYRGPEEPDAFSYMTTEEQARFFAALPEWDAEQRAKGLKDEEISLLQREFMATFMSDSKKEAFLELFYVFKEARESYNKALDDYLNFRERLREDGSISVVMNNSCLSPDGARAYFTGVQTFVIDPTLGEDGIVKKNFPIMFDVETGEYTIYSPENNLQVTSVAEDYSLICRIIGIDDYWPSNGWIYPEADEEKGMYLSDYVQEYGTEEAFDWMETNMYREVIAGVSDTGTLRYDDAWTVGVPYCTPDLGLIACANSTMYWNDNYAMTTNYVSFVLNTGLKIEDSAVEEIVADGQLTGLEIYDLSGVKVYSGNTLPQLPSGLYIVKSSFSDGSTTVKKVIL